MVGIDSGDSDFDTAEETGGSKTHTLTVNEMPSHKHHQGTGASSGSRQWGQNAPGGDGAWASDQGSDSTRYTNYVGGGAAHNNVQPYIVVYMWKRTA